MGVIRQTFGDLLRRARIARCQRRQLLEARGDREFQDRAERREQHARGAGRKPVGARRRDCVGL